jgi:predicted DNA-binding transcriptional regulator YafY
MYSPTSRLLTVLELLQSYKHMSGSEMARRLEVDVRTVRRYIVTLQDMGIPVEAERGPYGAYQLARGFKLPPLMFTDAEAVALTLGLITIRQLKFPVNVAAVEGALAKTERVMPDKLLSQVRGLQEAIIFNVIRPAPVLPNNDYIVTLSTAVMQRQQVHMHYQSFQGADSERDFSPYGIVFNDGYWYTAGYCHLRQDVRTFRLDRITSVEPIERTFEMPPDFDVLDYVMRAIGSPVGANSIEVLLKTSMEHAQQVILPMMGTLEETDEGVIFRRNGSELDWIAHILLRLDFPVVIRQTQELRQIVREMGTRALQILDDNDD